MNARDQLILAAEKVFNDFGYRRASMADVSRIAGVSRQGLYHHFRNKSELFAAVIGKAHAGTVDKSIQAREAARARGADYEEIVTAMIDERFGQMLRDLQKSPHSVEIFEEAMKRCADIILEQNIRFHKLLADLTESEMKARRLTLAQGLSADILLNAFVTMARGVSLMQPPADPANLREEYARHIKLLMHGARV